MFKNTSRSRSVGGGIRWLAIGAAEWLLQTRNHNDDNPRSQLGDEWSLSIRVMVNGLVTQPTLSKHTKNVANSRSDSLGSVLGDRTNDSGWADMEMRRTTQHRMCSNRWKSCADGRWRPYAYGCLGQMGVVVQLVLFPHRDLRCDREQYLLKECPHDQMRMLCKGAILELAMPIPCSTLGMVSSFMWLKFGIFFFKKILAHV